MNFKLISALAAGLLMSAPTFAANVTLGFEGTEAFGSIGDFYNGGAGGNYGITFGDDALSYDAFEVDVGQPLFNDPTLGSRIMAPVGDGAATMNVAQGFNGQISFQYAATAATSISLYSGLNGTGDLLSTISLEQNIADGACTTSALCLWNLVTLDFGGVARSATFGDAVAAGVSNATFDNVQISAVPLPAAGWLLMSALGGVGAWSRRKRAVAAA